MSGHARGRWPCSRRRAAAGFTLVELAVVVVAVAILVGVVLDRLLPLIGRAERVAFLHTEADLQTALLLEAAERITSGETERVAELADGNPMRFFLKPPQNYVGSLHAAEAQTAPRASWYYDEDAARLVYRVGKHTRFDALGGPDDRVEFRVALVYEDRDGDAAFEPSRDRFEGLRLQSAHAYNWPE